MAGRLKDELGFNPWVGVFNEIAPAPLDPRKAPKVASRFDVPPVPLAAPAPVGGALPPKDDGLSEPPAPSSSQEESMEMVKQIGTSQNPYRDVLDKFTSNIQNREGEISGMEDELSALKKTEVPWVKQLNLRPLMALADRFAGGNTAPYYSKPQAQERKDAQKALLQKRIDAKKDALNKDQLSLLKTKADADILRQKLRAKSSKRTGKQSERIQKDLLGFWDDLNEEATGAAQTFNQMDAAFERNDYQSVMSHLAQFARAISGEKGVLTNKDIERVVPSNFHGSISKFISWIQDVPTEELPAKFTNNLRELVEIAKKKTKTKFNRRINGRQDIMDELPAMRPVSKEVAPAFNKMRKKMSEAFKSNLEGTTESPGGAESFEQWKKKKGEK